MSELLGKSASARHVGGALAYALPSLGVMFLNKCIFAAPYSFVYPRLLALLQFSFSALLLTVVSRAGLVPMRPMRGALMRACAPLSALFLVNSILGIYALSGENVPMFAALRHLTTLLVLLFEVLLLARWPSPRALAATAVTVLGTLIAAAHDLSFDPWAYAYVGLYNLCTALYLVTIRYTAVRQRRVGGDEPPTPLEMLYCNTLLALPLLAVLCLASENVHDSFRSTAWLDPKFVVLLIASLISASLCELGLYVNTALNSPMAQNATGVMKNTLASGIGMTMADYKYSHLNLVGLVVNAIGACWYSYLKMHRLELDTSEAENAEEQREKDVLEWTVHPLRKKHLHDDSE